MPTVFVVNSNAKTTNALTQMLRQAGFHTLSMTDAEMTMAVLRAIRADLIMVDLSRPQTHGAELIDKLRRDRMWTSLPIVAIGARVEADCRLLRRRVGVGEVLTEDDSSPNVLLTQVRKYTTPTPVISSGRDDADERELPGRFGWNN